MVSATVSSEDFRVPFQTPAESQKYEAKHKPAVPRLKLLIHACSDFC